MWVLALFIAGTLMTRETQLRPVTSKCGRLPGSQAILVAAHPAAIALRRCSEALDGGNLEQEGASPARAIPRKSRGRLTKSLATPAATPCDRQASDDTEAKGARFWRRELEFRAKNVG
jgi:hypothetical protein